MSSPKRQVRCKGPRLRVAGEMTIYTAATLQKELFGSLRDRPAVNSLDLSEVTEIDTAGIQMVLLAQRTAVGLGRELRIINPSSAVSDVFELLQIPIGVAQGGAS